MIYQIVDATSDEMYFTLANFTDFEAAKKSILERAKPDCALTDSNNYDGFERICIYEYALGWCEIKKVVYTLERNKEYNEATDQYEWVNA